MQYLVPFHEANIYVQIVYDKHEEVELWLVLGVDYGYGLFYGNG